MIQQNYRIIGNCLSQNFIYGPKIRTTFAKAIATDNDTFKNTGQFIHGFHSTSIKQKIDFLSASTISSAHFDLIVVGSGPAAQKCAIDTVKRGKRVALVDKQAMMGGACVHTGTIPSKTFREAVLHITGWRHQGFFGKSYFAKSRGTSFGDILNRVHKVEDGEAEISRYQLSRNGVFIMSGTARFAGEADGKVQISVNATTKLDQVDNTHATSAYRHKNAKITKTVISADKVLIACGTRPARLPNVKFDGVKVFDSDQLLYGDIKHLPRQLVVVGAGVIGIEYASMINAMPGTNVTIIDPRDKVLNFADKEVVDSLMYSMRQQGARFLLGESLKEIINKPDEKGCVVVLSSGKRIACDGCLYAMGRQGNSDTLDLDVVHLEPDKRGLLQVNDFYQTEHPNIYAAGDCIGYPALASTSMEQGRRASCHMWGDYDHITVSEDELRSSSAEVQSVMTADGFLGRHSEQLFPYGIYTIPEISMIGKSEEQLTAEKIAYEVGMVRYRELAKGQMLGGMDGFLKIIFSPDDYKILGVHAFGEGATEIVHIGQVIMTCGGDIRYFRDAVFNYPTLAEAYTVAAQNGLRKLGIL